METIKNNKKIKSKDIPHRGKAFEGLVFSIRRVKRRDFELFYLKTKDSARYYKFKIKRKGIRFYTVLMAYK